MQATIEADDHELHISSTSTLGLLFGFSKKQTTIETSLFGAEFIALKPGMECL